MNCPICRAMCISPDASVVEKHGRKVILQGMIRGVGFHASPYSDYYTVSLYPIKSKHGVKYLKFRTEDELKRWGFISDKLIRCEGCLHEIDNKDIVFDITSVEFL